jgi:hypothetical protein
MDCKAVFPIAHGRQDRLRNRLCKRRTNDRIDRRPRYALPFTIL